MVYGRKIDVPSCVGNNACVVVAIRAGDACGLDFAWGSCGDGGREMGRRCSFDDVGRWGRRRGVKVGKCGISGREKRKEKE